MSDLTSSITRLMTWNVQNLFLPGTRFGPPDDATYENKLAALAATIDAAQPEALLLQEVGDPQALDDLCERLAVPLPHRQLATPDDRGIRVAIASAVEPTEVTEIRPFADGLLPVQSGDDPPGPEGPPMINEIGRAALRASFVLGGETIDVVTCHLKSKLLTFPGGRFSPRDEDERARVGAYALYRRAAEAATIRVALTGLLDGRGEDRAVVLGGDLNDEVLAATTLIVNGPPGSEIGTLGFDRPDRGDPERMWNLAPLIPETERFTRVYRGRRELIDHVFCSQALVERAISVRTVPTHGMQLPSITDDPMARRAMPGSDHAAIVAEFRSLRPA